MQTILSPFLALSRSIGLAGTNALGDLSPVIGSYLVVLSATVLGELAAQIPTQKTHADTQLLQRSLRFI